MASEDHPVYTVEDLDDDDDDDVVEEDDDEDVEDDDDDSTSSSNVATAADRDPTTTPLPLPPPVSSSVGQVTIAVAGDPSLSVLPDPKRQRVDSVVVEEKKTPMPLDESRRLFQRLWTDEDEIELLQGFLDYTSHRGPHQHHDTSAFYDQIKNKLQLDFNKNQLVEKLRRLKKKYRNVLSKIAAGKEYIFKSPHDQTTFEISCKIWSGVAGRGGTPAGHVVEEAGFDDDEANLNTNPSMNSIDHSNINGIDINSSEKKTSRSRKRSRGVKIEERPQFLNSPALPQPVTVGVPTATTGGSIPGLIEETVKSCLSPLFKELLHGVMNSGACNSRGFGLTLNSMPMSFGVGPLSFMGGGDAADEKWRRQQILELEVYSKRLELVQDQIKAQLEELRSIENS